MQSTKCAYCGVEIKGRRITAKYCSAYCRKTSYKPQKCKLLEMPSLPEKIPTPEKFTAPSCAKRVHSKSAYVTALADIRLVCKIHGAYEQVYTKRLKGTTCPLCATRAPSDNDLLYVHKVDDCFLKGVQVYKIGVTSQRLDADNRQRTLEKALGSKLTNILYLPTNSCPATELETLLLNRFTIQPDWRCLCTSHQINAP